MRWRLTWRARLPLIVAIPSVMRSGAISLSITCRPDSAQTWAIPLPICPAPTTPILRIGCTVCSVRAARATGRSLTSLMSQRLLYDDPPACSTRRHAKIQRKIQRWSTLHLAQFGRQFRQDLVEIADKAVIGDLKDRRLLVLI